MRINASDIIPIYQSLARGDERLGNYDLHNEFYCVKIVFKCKVLHLVNTHEKEGYCVVMSFYNAELEIIDMDLTDDERTVESIYRSPGGPIVENEPYNAKPFFRIHFTYGHIMSLWTDSIGVERYDDIPAEFKEVTLWD